VSLSYRDNLQDPSRADLANAANRPLDIPTIAWPIVISVVGGLLLGIVFGRRRRKESVSNLDGRLLVALQRRRATPERLRKAA
jgi:hypothetical protein